MIRRTGGICPFAPAYQGGAVGTSPVDDAAEVEAGGHQHRRAREVLAVAEQHVGERPVRDQEPAPVHRRERVLERAARGPRGRARAGAGWWAACRARCARSTADRVVDLQAPEQRVRVVVRHVVSARSTPTSGGRRCPRRGRACGGRRARARRGRAMTAPSPPGAGAAAGAGPGVWRRRPPPRPTRAFAGREYFAKPGQHSPARIRPSAARRTAAAA